MMVCSGRLLRARTRWDGRHRARSRRRGCCSMMPVFSVADRRRRNVEIERIDQRHRHAVAVDHREMNRVAAGRRTRRQRSARRARSIRPASVAGEALSSSADTEIAHRRPGSADVSVAHRVGEARRLEHADGRARRRADRARAQIEILQDVEQRQRGEPLRVGRQSRGDRARDSWSRSATTGSPRWRGEIVGASAEPARGKRRHHVLARSALRRTRAAPSARDRLQVAASAGSLMTSPSAGARPPNR